MSAPDKNTASADEKRISGSSGRDDPKPGQKRTSFDDIMAKYDEGVVKRARRSNELDQELAAKKAELEELKKKHENQKIAAEKARREELERLDELQPDDSQQMNWMDYRFRDGSESRDSEGNPDPSS